MHADAELDLVVFGATGYTGRLVAEYLAANYPGLAWGMAGRSGEKLAAVRDAVGAPKELPLIVADSSDRASLAAMARRAKAVVTTVGPYQLYGSELVAACAETGTDYLDLCGEPLWMRAMIDAHEAQAKDSGARILLSSGFDSIPFELGVWFVQKLAREQLGHTVPRVKSRVRAIRGGMSGGSAASSRAMIEAIQRDRSLVKLLVNPFALTPGFEGPAQPRGDQPEHDPDVDAEVGPFIMAGINTKNVHRSNLLLGHPYGTDFVYDEMAVVRKGAPAAFSAEGGMPKPGEGPTQAEREAGHYDVLVIGIDADGRQVRAAVKGDMDPGYGSTAKILSEAALCLVQDCPDAPAGGIWVPAAAMGDKLLARMPKAGVTFTPEPA